MMKYLNPRSLHKFIDRQSKRTLKWQSKTFLQIFDNTSLYIHKNLCTFTKDFLNNRTVTVEVCKDEMRKLFCENKIGEPMASAEYIIAYVLSKKTMFGVQSQRELSNEQLKKCLALAEERLKRMPIQYVIGEWDFRELTLKMRPPVFIPRPETEELVQHALDDPVVQAASRFLEVGSGSGAISFALLKALPQVQAVCIDENIKACQLTSENAALLGLTDRCDVLNLNYTDFEKNNKDMFDFVISNPPYIPQEDMKNLQDEVKLYEDDKALHGGSDGMDVIREILTTSHRLLKPEGTLWLEVDGSHPKLIEKYVHTTPGLNLTYLQTIKDFRNMPRFCQLRYT